MSWRKIEVDGEQYRWRGSKNIVIQNSKGVRISEPVLTPWQLKGITEKAWYSGQYHGIITGMIRPSDIKNYILYGKPNCSEAGTERTVYEMESEMWS